MDVLQVLRKILATDFHRLKLTFGLGYWESFGYLLFLKLDLDLDLDTINCSRI